MGRLTFAGNRAVATILAVAGAGAAAARAADRGVISMRDSVDLTGTWQTLSGHAAEPIWRRETAAKHDGWRAASVPGRTPAGLAPKAFEALKGVWARRTFGLTRRQAGRDAASERISPKKHREPPQRARD